MAIINYLVASVLFLAIVQGTTITPNESLSKDTDNANSTDVEPAVSLRTGRIMTIFNKEPKLSPNRFGPPPHERIRSRSDHFPPPAVQQRYPGAFQRYPIARPPNPQILRRVQNNIPNGHLQRLGPNQLPRYDLVKSSRYSASKNGLHYPSGKGGPYRPQPHFGSSDVTDTVAVIASSLHQPNSLGQGQSGHKYQFGQYFKPSPNYSGNVIVRPIADQHPQFSQHQQQSQQQQLTYPTQHPFPKQQPLYQRDSFSQKPLHQSPIQQHPYTFQQPLIKPIGQQEPLLSPKTIPNHVHFENNSERPAIQQLYTKSTPSHSYSVHEEEDQPLFTPADSKDAQEYLKFMSSNGYFLPKVDPNYKKIDDERDNQQLRQQQKQQDLLKQLHYQKSTYDSSGAASTYQNHKQHLQQQQQQQQQPIKVSQLFFHDNPSPPASSTVVRSSYQTGHNNNFVVNSDGQKVGKRVVSFAHSTLGTSIPPHSTTSTTPSSGSYHHFHYSSSRNRTPEPLRFEFTERDAITPATYTHSPQNAQQRNSIAVGNDAFGVSGNNYIARTTTRIPSTTTQPPSTTASYKYNNNIKPVNEDDPEDGEDMHHAGSDFYGRAPVNPSQAATTPEPPSEQKDTEDYCERICANVQDDDEEIVCGSDGFMYTSEAQMECYASCLHIDVTIQSKGSCSAT